MRKILAIIFCLFMLSFLIKCKIEKAKAKYSISTINFGVKLRTDTIKGQFFLENIGDESLIIEAIEPTCGCTIPKYEKSPIEKGMKRKVEFVYVPKLTDSSAVHKEIIIKTNSEKRLHVITIKGKLQ